MGIVGEPDDELEKLLSWVDYIQMKARTPIRAGTTGKSIFDAVVPLIDASPLKGHTPRAALLFLSSTQEMLRPIDEDKKVTTIAIDDRSGTVLMHYPPLPAAVGASAADLGLVHVVSSTRGVRSAAAVSVCPSRSLATMRRSSAPTSCAAR